MRSLISFTIVLLLVFPYLILGFNGINLQLPDGQEFYYVVKGSLLQSTLSTVISLVLGTLGALGLVSVPLGRKRRILELMCLLPSFVPTIFVVISWLNLIDTVSIDVTGLWSVVIVHALINTGLVSVLLSFSIDSKVLQFSRVSQVLGAGKLKFARSVLLPLLKFDYIYVGSLVFVFCLSSFTIPVMLGGIRPLSLEVFIYQQMRLTGEVSVAIAVGVLQLLMLSVILFKINRMRPIPNANTDEYSFAYDFKYFLIIPIFIFVFIACGELPGLYDGVVLFAQDYALLKSDVLRAISGTLIITTLSSVFVFIFLCLFGLMLSHKKLLVFILTFQAPSSTVIGLSLILFGFFSEILSISMGLFWLYINLVFRLIDRNYLEDLFRQTQVSKVLGASRWMIYKKIIFPQWVHIVARLSGLVAFWASGEFALSKVVARSDISLGLLSQTIASQYRLELSTVLVWVMLLIGVCFYLAYKGIGNVFSKKYS